MTKNLFLARDRNKMCARPLAYLYIFALVFAINPHVVFAGDNDNDTNFDTIPLLSDPDDMDGEGRSPRLNFRWLLKAYTLFGCAKYPEDIQEDVENALPPNCCPCSW